MPTKVKQPQPGSTAAILACAGASAVLLSLLPIEALTVLTIWMLGSFPIGILIGHCVLREAAAPPGQYPIISA